MTMQSPDEIRRDLPSDLEPSESEELVALAMRLQAQRPAPAPSFRGELSRKLLRVGGARAGLVKRRTARVLAASYVASGLLLLGIAAIGLAGAGPFAPS
jgi:hypothetical protein